MPDDREKPADPAPRKDPRDTDHPTGEKQAKENVENDPPG
jgi:hypothetical protein